MDISETLLTELKFQGYDFFISVPCVFLQKIIRLLEQDATVVYTPATREEEAIGIAAGAQLGGKQPVILMQSSGLGNSINAICSLINFYQIPILFLISHRGTEVEKIEAQKPMGKIMKSLLSTVNIDFFVFKDQHDISKIDNLVDDMQQDNESKAILLHPNFWRTTND